MGFGTCTAPAGVPIRRECAQRSGVGHVAVEAAAAAVPEHVVHRACETRPLGLTLAHARPSWRCKFRVRVVCAYVLLRGCFVFCCCCSQLHVERSGGVCRMEISRTVLRAGGGASGESASDRG